mmetsp:Transcript_25565/g.63413  ORF Transcript_25565/g.63413 Transcript_25565/m.63413 type:complete len:266 (+) Transcript_25565:441-1238(+)
MHRSRDGRRLLILLLSRQRGAPEFLSGGKVVLRCRPLLRVRLSRVHLQRRLVPLDRRFHIRRPVATDPIDVRGSEVILCRRPVLRVRLPRAHLQRCLVPLDRRLHIRRPLATDPIAIRVCEVMLRHRPVLRVCLPCVHLQHRLVPLDRRLHVRRPLATDPIAVCGGEVVLRRRPLLRVRLPREYPQHRLVARKGQLEAQSALVPHIFAQRSAYIEPRLRTGCAHLTLQHLPPCGHYRVLLGPACSLEDGWLDLGWRNATKAEQQR